MTTCANYPLENACSRRGAQMGRCDILPENTHETVKLSLVKLQWQDGDYDQGGAYWGQTPGTWIFRAVGDTKYDGITEVFVRATSREDAKKNILLKMPGARFYR